ncbi:MAG: dehydrogenase [Deltaproteobacteria bacterium]|mgnify:CR=1 FL=1|jgi:UDP-N-acetylglucosamine 3-dehydrogenase|nr:MAG: dehydrogenase [Deltaproteobacteria bacterium]
MLRFGIVGYDHPHIIRYAPTIATHRHVRLTAIAAIGLNKEMAKRDAERFGSRYYEDLDEFVSSEELDAIYIATDPSRHLEVVSKTAPKGVHILCDKPIAISLKEADGIISLAEKNGVKLMVPFNPPYQLGVIRMKEMIEKGEFGDIYNLNATKYGKIPTTIKGMDTSWFLDKSRAGFGGFADIGIHAVYGLMWLIQKPVKKVYAKIERKLYKEIPVDDIGVALMEFEGGTVGTVSAGWANPLGFPTHLDATFEVLGSKGAMVVIKPYHDFKVFDQEKTESVNWWRVDIARLVDEFVMSILENREPAITGKDARDALEVVVAAYRSSETGTEVTLPLTV